MNLMKKLNTLFFALVSLVSGSLSAADVFVTSGTASYAARAFDGAPVVAASAPIVFGGLGDAQNAGWAGKIVLLDRGAISFADKVKAVKSAGGVAVVIANNVAGAANSGTIKPDVSTIPAVSVSQADGEALRAISGAVVTVGPKPPTAPPIALPDPAGHAGEYLVSDGTKYILAKLPVTEPGASMSSEIAVGQRLAFSVATNGTPPFSYQWIKDGQNISGATNAAFVVAAVTSADAGSYLCQVSNATGAAASAVHNVTVKP
jgi:hypothetical protein